MTVLTSLTRNSHFKHPAEKMTLDYQGQNDQFVIFVRYFTDVKQRIFKDLNNFS